jgi:long-chain acyl-CoA synthetase
MTNLTHMLEETVAEHGDRIAIKLDDLEIPYNALDAGSAGVAGLLKSKGIGPGDRVGLMLPNLPYFPFAFYAVLRLGASVVPMNPLLKEREVAFHLSDSGAKALVAWNQFADAARAGAEKAGAECIVVEPGEFEKQVGESEPVEETAERDDDDTALILYTSGTTGTPKGAELTHENLHSATQISVDLVDSGPETVTFGALPLFHVFGLTSGLNSCVRVGACLTLLPRFDPGKALEIVQRDKVSIFLGVPTMYAAMLHHEDHESFDASSLELCVSGGAAMPVEILRGFEEAFGCKILEGYGMSETCAIASFNRPDRERKPGSIGIPVPGVEMKLVDGDGNDVPQGEVGEILIRGPVVMKSYWNRQDATAETLDEDG